jgi:hypothetical protein
VECNSSCTSGQTAKVTTKYQYYYITPIKRLVSFFSAGSLPTYLTVQTSTSMRIE